ncbi:ceramidase, partial [Blyttiomyces helicus]
PTSTLDWCEENYILSSWLAEAWNASSNIFFQILPLIGLVSVWKTHAEARFAVAYVALMLTGVGSFLFHGTLLYSAQLLDELPMVFGGCVSVYVQLQMWGTPRHRPLTVALLALYGLSTALIYLYLRAPIFFQSSFGILTFFQVLLNGVNVAWAAAAYPAHKRTLWGGFAAGVGAFLAAYALWTLDQKLCPTLQSTRAVLGYPLSPLLELHAWWHVLTAFAGYVAVSGAQFARALVLGRKDVRVFYGGGILPVVWGLEVGKLKEW